MQFSKIFKGKVFEFNGQGGNVFFQLKSSKPILWKTAARAAVRRLPTRERDRYTSSDNDMFFGISYDDEI